VDVWESVAAHGIGRERVDVRGDLAPNVLGWRPMDENVERTGDEALVQAIAESVLFRKAPSSREVLLYLWKHREATPSEYAIGVDVLGRRADFDPKVDSTVRVQVSRLRQRLRDYYQGEGRSSERQLQIPAGGYRVEWAVVAQAVPPQAVSRRWVPWALCAGLGLVAADDLRLRLRTRPSLHPFLARFVERGRELQLVVPVPLFFRWPGASVVMRDFRVNEVGKRDQSPHLKSLTEKLGEPETTQLYTVASDTLAASTLSRYFEERGIPAAVMDSPAATVDLLASRDTALFVGPGSWPQMADLLGEMNFVLRSGTGQVISRNPRAGEPESFDTKAYSPVHSSSHGVFARLPGKGRNTQLLVFASSFNPALASLLTNQIYLDEMQKLHAKSGAPPYFEVVVEYERNGDRLLRLRPLLLRSVNASR
jgi:hypothetical protein